MTQAFFIQNFKIASQIYFRMYSSPHQMQNSIRLFFRIGKCHHGIVTHSDCYWKKSKGCFRASIIDIDCYVDIFFYNSIDYISLQDRRYNNDCLDNSFKMLEERFYRYCKNIIKLSTSNYFNKNNLFSLL